MQSLMMYEIGNTRKPPVKVIVPICITLVSNKLAVTRLIQKSVPIKKNGTLTLLFFCFIILVFNVVFKHTDAIASMFVFERKITQFSLTQSVHLYIPTNFHIHQCQTIDNHGFSSTMSSVFSHIDEC